MKCSTYLKIIRSREVQKRFRILPNQAKIITIKHPYEKFMGVWL